MQQSGKISLGGGNAGSLTAETILYGKGTNITDIDYNQITYNRLVFKQPFIITNCNIQKSLNTSNEITIDRDLIYYKDEINNIFQYKLSNGLGIVINDLSNISVNFNDGGWCSNINNNYLYTYSSNIGIGISNPRANLHIYNNNPLITIQDNLNNLFNLTFTNNDYHKYFSLNNKLLINTNANENSLIIENYNNITINSNLYVNGIMRMTNNILINNVNIIDWLSNNNNFATRDFVINNQLMTNNTILYGIGNNITNIDYNNININKLKFISPLNINTNNNIVSIDTNLLGFNINNTNNIIYVNNLSYNLGIGNTNPLSYLHIGNYINNTTTRNDPSIIISKINTDNFNRNFKLGIDENFNFSIGNFNIRNDLINSWVKQFIIYNGANANSIILDDLNNTIFNTNLSFNSNIFINNNSSIIFNNNFNINYNNNNFNINNYLFINNLGNIGIGTNPNNFNKLIINGDLNILSNINSSNIISLYATINNLNNRNLITNNINSVSINNYSLITTSDITINNLTNTNIINNSSLITSKNLSISSTINSANLNSSNGTIINLTSTKISTDNITVSTIFNGNIINLTDTINTIKIIANTINNTSLITTNNLTVLSTLSTNIINNSLSITTNSLTINNITNANQINANLINSTSINNTTSITTNTLNTSTINNTNNLITNNATIYSTLNVNNNIIANYLSINNSISTVDINITNSLNTNFLICKNNIRFGNGTNNINSVLQIYDIDPINKSSFIISGIYTNYRFGYESTINNDNFIIGSFNNSSWIKQIIINKNAPNNSIVINNNGNVGIGLTTINDNINNSYKLNVNGSLNAITIFQNGENLITSNILNNIITNKLINYTNTTDLYNNFIQNTYLTYVLDDNNNNLQNYINNFLTINCNVYSPILRFPETYYDPMTYVLNSNLTNYLNNSINAYKESIVISNIDVNLIQSVSRYDIYSSSKIGFFAPNKAILFNYTNSSINNLNSLWNYNNYYNNGLFNSTINLVNSNNIFNKIKYYGDYIIIKLPKNLILNKFRFYALKDNLKYAPGNWKCIYSNDDGNNWNELADASLSSDYLRLNIQDYKLDIYNNYYYEKKLLNNNINCIYIGFIFNSLAKSLFTYDTGTVHLELARIELFFNQIVQPIYISSNVLNNYLNNYPTFDIFNYKQDKITFSSDFLFTNNNLSLNFNKYLSEIGNVDTNFLSNTISNYINSLNNIWSPVNGDEKSIYYNNNGSVGIGTSIPNTYNYKLDVNGSINCCNINAINNLFASTINANSIIGNGSLITNLNYNNIYNKPAINNVNNIIYDTYKNNYYTSNLNSSFSIGYNNNDNNYKLTVNGSILSVANINAINNIQENNVNLKDKYLTITNASNTYLNINGGNITNYLNINNNNIDPSYKLVVNGNINCFSNINSANYFINNININNIFLSIVDATNNYISKNRGGIINNDVVINTYLSIGTQIDYLYKLNVNGNINSFSNIYANNFIENGNNLINKYLTIIDASNNYFKNIGGNINGNINIIGSLNTSNIYSNNILIDFNSYLTKTNFNNIISLYPTLDYLTTNYLTSNDLITNYSKTGTDPNYLKINSSGGVIGNLTINGILNTSSNINIGFSTSSISLNPNNYFLNINGPLNASNIYSNNILIDFNSYLTNINFNNTISLYPTLNYLTTNYLTSNDLIINYFSNYSKTGTDPNYLKINSSGGVIGNLIINGILNISSNINIGFSTSSIPLNPNNYFLNINGPLNASNIYSNNILIDFNSYLTNINFNNTISLYPTLNYLTTNYLTSNDLIINYFSNYSKTGTDPNYLKINSSGGVIGNLNINGILNISSNINIGFSTSSIPLNQNNYFLNINGPLNSTNIYSNNILIDFNSYLTKTNFNNTISLYPTLNYLNTNYLTSNDLIINYFSNYSKTGNDPNYLKINSSGIVLNTSNLIISNSISSININTSNLISSNLIISNSISSININTSNLISSNLIISNSISSININTSNLNSSNIITSNINCQFDILSTNFIENGSNLKNKYLTITNASNTYFNINSNNFILGKNILNYNLNINGSINCYSNIVENGSNLRDKYLMIENLTSTFNSNIYNFVNVQKKFGFRVMCSIPVILNNITYYKYDINIPKYIKDRNDSLNLNSYRIFNIKCFTVDTIFDTGIANKAPNILQYDIYMSLLDINNVNVIAIGFPSNYYLTKITAGDIFILKTTNYNYISILSRTINTKITCIISDILF